MNKTEVSGTFEGSAEVVVNTAAPKWAAEVIGVDGVRAAELVYSVVVVLNGGSRFHFGVNQDEARELLAAIGINFDLLRQHFLGRITRECLSRATA